MRLRLVVLGLSLPLLAVGLAAQDNLTQATEAYRKGEFRSAAKLFAAAAAKETDPAARADIRVKLAWTYWGMNDRSKAEEALSAALGDQPQLELVPEFYTPDFLALFNRVKARSGTGPGRAAPTQPAGPRQAGTAGALAALRQRLAQAVDNSAVEAILSDAKQLELATPVAQLSEVLELEAQVLDRLGRTGAALEQRGRVAAMRAAAQAAPGTPVVPLETLLEARRLLATGKPQDAESLMRGVLVALPSCVPALEVLGEALLEDNKLDEAYNALRTALLGNEKPELLLALGEVEIRRGHLAGAREAFRRVVELDPGNDRGWSALGLLAARMDDVVAARDALDTALAANGTLFEARVVRAEIALVDGQPAAALQHLQRALQVKPDDPWATGWTGVALLATGTLPSAVERLTVGYGAVPATFALPLAEALRRQGKVQDALAVLAAAKTASAELVLLKARCLLDAGKPQDAAGLLRDLAGQRPEDGRVHYLLGCALHDLRSWADAAGELAKAAALANAPPSAKDAAANARATLAAQQLMDAALVPPPPPVKR